MEKQRVLVVDDDREIVNAIAINLQNEGYEVLKAYDGLQALDIISTQNIQLIILDVMMPDGSGFGFCSELRQKTNAPVIFLTCRDENESVVKGLLQGGDDYVTKPYDLNVLSARVAAQLRRAGVMTAGRIELFPLAIDFLSGEATLEGKHIPLTQKELQLLGCFALFPGQRLSAEEIYRRAWGEPSPGAAGTVKTHVANLRRKLRLDDGGWFQLSSAGKNEYIFSKVRY